MVRAHGLLNEAADLVQPSDAEFAGYLRNRARDLLSDDYELGDAAWVTGRFGNLNAQIGAYETYDDELLGTRAFYSLSLLATRREETAALRRGLQGLQAVEDALPYERRKRIREDIPGRRLRRDRRFRPVARRQHRFDPAQRGVPCAALRADDPASRQHHALAGDFRRQAAASGGRWWRRAMPPSSPPIRPSTARSGTRSATISALTAPATAATSTPRSAPTAICSKR